MIVGDFFEPTASFYGSEPPSHKTRCPNSNNPFGHSESCPCRAHSHCSAELCSGFCLKPDPCPVCVGVEVFLKSQ